MTLLLDWLKPRDAPDSLGRGDEAFSAYPLQPRLPAPQRPLLYLYQAICKNGYFLPVVSLGGVLWKSRNAGDETLGKPEHAHSVLYHHMVKFSPPSDLINGVYKFLGMSP